mmetsp:Transcript_26048/g.72835  ORF Transcript_26048/g.72835 Transcript_26048/m.72835 type:complete len:218 (-) Transcript_26048:6-659(-)
MQRSNAQRLHRRAPHVRIFMQQTFRRQVHHKLLTLHERTQRLRCMGPHAHLHVLQAIRQKGNTNSRRLVTLFGNRFQRLQRRIPHAANLAVQLRQERSHHSIIVQDGRCHLANGLKRRNLIRGEVAVQVSKERPACREQLVALPIVDGVVVLENLGSLHKLLARERDLPVVEDQLFHFFDQGFFLYVQLQRLTGQVVNHHAPHSSGTQPAAAREKIR